MVGLREAYTSHFANIALQDGAPRILGEHVSAHHAETSTADQWPEEYDRNSHYHGNRRDVLLCLSPGLMDPAYECPPRVANSLRETSFSVDCPHEIL